MTRWSIRQSISKSNDGNVNDGTNNNDHHGESATSHTDTFRGSFEKAKSMPERDSILLSELDLSPPKKGQQSVHKLAFSEGHKLHLLSPTPSSPSAKSPPMTAPPSLASKISEGRGDGLAAYLKSPLLVESDGLSIKRRSSMKEEVEDVIRKPSNHYKRRNSQMRPSDVMTMDQLRFSSLGLYGRDKEQATLNSCLERLLEMSNQDIIQNLLWETHQNLNFNTNTYIYRKESLKSALKKFKFMRSMNQCARTYFSRSPQK